MANKKTIAWDETATPQRNAGDHLPGLARKYFQSGRELLEKRPSAQTLHHFRLETKRFRYTLELFRPCYGPGLDQRLQKLREIQGHLGEISDCSATMELAGRSSTAFRGYLRRRMAAKTEALHIYWRERFDAAGQEGWWTKYLAHSVRKQVRHEHNQSH